MNSLLMAAVLRTYYQQRRTKRLEYEVRGELCEEPESLRGKPFDLVWGFLWGPTRLGYGSRHSLYSLGMTIK